MGQVTKTLKIAALSLGWMCIRIIMDRSAGHYGLSWVELRYDYLIFLSMGIAYALVWLKHYFTSSLFQRDKASLRLNKITKAFYVRRLTQYCIYLALIWPWAVTKTIFKRAGLAR